jgi:hypothetical protein
MQIIFRHIPDAFIEQVVSNQRTLRTAPFFIPEIEILCTTFLYLKRVERVAGEGRRHDLRGWGLQADASIGVTIHQGTSERTLPMFPTTLVLNDRRATVANFCLAQVGTADSVRGLPRELTEKLITESLEAQ